jgi:hypothetical protein
MKGIITFLIALVLCVVVDTTVSAAEKVPIVDEVTFAQADACDSDVVTAFATVIYSAPLPAGPTDIFIRQPEIQVLTASAKPDYRHPWRLELSEKTYRKTSVIRFNPGLNPIKQC